MSSISPISSISPSTLALAFALRHVMLRWVLAAVVLLLLAVLAASARLMMMQRSFEEEAAIENW